MEERDNERCPRCGASVFSDDVTVMRVCQRKTAFSTTYLCRCGEVFTAEWADLATFWGRIKAHMGESHAASR